VPAPFRPGPLRGHPGCDVVRRGRIGAHPPPPDSSRAPRTSRRWDGPTLSASRRSPPPLRAWPGAPSRYPRSRSRARIKEIRSAETPCQRKYAAGLVTVGEFDFGKCVDHRATSTVQATTPPRRAYSVSSMISMDATRARNSPSMDSRRIGRPAGDGANPSDPISRWIPWLDP